MLNYYYIFFFISCRILVERRNPTGKFEALGIYPGAKVSRGPDWEYGNHDGGTFGTVTKITNWHGNPSCAADVLWESGTQGTYRLGYQGKVMTKSKIGILKPAWCACERHNGLHAVVRDVGRQLASHRTSLYSCQQFVS